MNLFGLLGTWHRRALPYVLSLQLLLGVIAQPATGAAFGKAKAAGGAAGEAVGQDAGEAALVREFRMSELTEMKNFITLRGRDRSGRPFAVDSNGVTCTYQKANSRELELSLRSVNGEELGSIAYHRVTSAFGGGMGREGRLSGISVSYRTAAGTVLSVGNTGSKDNKDLELSFSTREFGEVKSLKGEVDRSAGGEPLLSGDLTDIGAKLKGDAKLLTLLKASGIFLTNEAMTNVLGRPVALFDPGLSCLRAGAQCLCMAAIYVATLTGLVLACGETVGLGCYAAIAIHPAVCCEVAEVCSAAVDACENPCFN